MAHSIAKYREIEMGLIEAVVKVYDDFIRRGLKPGSGRWELADEWPASDGENSRMLVSEVRTVWFAVATKEFGREPLYFPYNTTQVTQWWTRYRREPTSAKQAIHAELNIPWLGVDDDGSEELLRDDVVPADKDVHASSGPVARPVSPVGSSRRPAAAPANGL